jgi:hypothetical protein
VLHTHSHGVAFSLNPKWFYKNHGKIWRCLRVGLGILIDLIPLETTPSNQGGVHVHHIRGSFCLW